MKQIIEWGIRSSGTLHSFDLGLDINVSKQPASSIFKGQAVKQEMDCLTFEMGMKCPETSVNINQRTNQNKDLVYTAVEA